MTTKRVSPGVIAPLQDALTAIYWYKNDLRDFVSAAISDRSLIGQLDWSKSGPPKRVLVRELVNRLAEDQHKHFEDLVDLILATSEMTDPAHLKPLEDGSRKYQEAVDAVTVLCFYVEPYRRMRSEVEAAQRRRDRERKLAESRIAISNEIGILNSLFTKISREPPQWRGYSLEALLNQLFNIYDIDAKGSFRNTGEQIDGAFSFDGTEFLLEAKWQQSLTTTSELDIFIGKINRKLDNTLGLFVSMNGFQSNLLTLAPQGGRPKVLLMDGSDLAVVLEERISFPDLLARKKQHAARTGEVYYPAWQIVTSY